jgi:hypothetical protein
MRGPCANCQCAAFRPGSARMSWQFSPRHDPPCLRTARQLVSESFVGTVLCQFVSPRPLRNSKPDPSRSNARALSICRLLPGARCRPTGTGSAYVGAGGDYHHTQGRTACHCYIGLLLVLPHVVLDGCLQPEHRCPLSSEHQGPWSFGKLRNLDGADRPDHRRMGVRSVRSATNLRFHPCRLRPDVDCVGVHDQL